MNIRQKCAAAIALSLAIYAIPNIAVLRFSVFPSFIELESQEATSDIHRIAGIVAAALVVLAVTVALISHVTEHLLAVGSSGNRSRRAGLVRSDEIGLLARQFDDMLEKLANARRRLLNQSYSAGVADMAAGVLHNIRNQLAPLSLRLGRLETAFDKTANSNLTCAIEELRSPTSSPERPRRSFGSWSSRASAAPRRRRRCSMS